MSKFSIKVVGLKMAEVVNNETNEVFNCAMEWHGRTIKGQRFQEIYVNVKDVKGKEMKDKYTLPIKYRIKENGKLEGPNPIGMTFETDLAGRQATAPTMDMFE